MPYYEYDFGLTGLCKLIFKKKTCPQCGQKLKRKEEREYAGKDILSSSRGMVVDKYRIKIWYHCEACGLDYKLKDL